MNKLARKHDVKGLIKALDYLDKSNSIDQLVGKHAATALQAIGGPAVEPLIGVIHDQTSSVRVQAVGVLGRLGDARAIEPLIGVLKDDDDWRVREAAAGGLRGFEVSMVEPLIGVLHDLNPSVRLQAVRTLADLGDARAVEPLIGVLQDDGDWRVSYAAEEALRPKAARWYPCGAGAP